MPIKNIVTGDVPYLRSYTPYVESAGNKSVDLIQDMVSVDMIPPTQPTTITYKIGTPNKLITFLTVKNLTSNTTLKINVDYDNTIFTIGDTERTIGPEQTTQFSVESNNFLLNGRVLSSLISTIFITVTNQVNGQLATKSVLVTPLQPRSFPTNIVL